MLSYDEILKVKQAFDRIMIEELKSRRIMEDKIKAHCKANGIPVDEGLKKFI